MKNEKEDLKKYLVKHTKCAIQSNGWPCGTCTIALLNRLGIKEDGIRNKPVDRINEVWRAILQVRGD